MGKFGALASSDKPFRVELIDPVTSSVIRDKDGNPAYIEVHAADGVIGRKFDKEQRLAQIEKNRKALVAIDTPADPVENHIAKCAALTVSWYLVDPDTHDHISVDCTPENAREFYSLPATDWFLQVWIKAVNNANFSTRSAAGSTVTQSGSQETAAA